ncbi:phage tail terminator family protein [Clostridium oryzae]|uniref:Phage protein n=1 Tax=Clostridium oryzae TaxID=1450648 RepID=A0A1V4IEL2_9CLOT|nr:hypothetical protein [Clostridium oryzae]OPJ58442.1 hypothetical protein CLORY_35920 [Clostridium oryzae]
MITLEKIKKSVVSALKSQKLKIYGTEIDEGFKRPCFFVQIVGLGSEIVNRNFCENLYTVEIAYFSVDKTDIENAKMYDVLRTIFSEALIVEDRSLICRKLRMSIVEDHVMSFKFDLSFYDKTRETTSDADIAEKLNLNIKGGIE